MSKHEGQQRTRKPLHLVEWEKTLFPHELMPTEYLPAIRTHYPGVIRVERDTLNDKNWYLTSLGYVGVIPLGSDLLLHLHPKTSVRNIFRMIACAYHLDIDLYDSHYQGDTLPDLVDALALVLAERLLQRIRRGLHREYVPQTERLEALRGRLDLPQFIRSDWRPDVPCTFGDQTVDNEENQILCWTLYLLLGSRRLSSVVAARVRKAWRVLSGSVSLVPCSSRQCTDRVYNRLMSDYQPMHLLCRFFLDHLLPAHQEGHYTSLCFLIDMGKLFERFVSEWLRSSTVSGMSGLYVSSQERVTVDSSSSVAFIFDILLKKQYGGETICVIDTKYKIPEKPSNEDIFQVVAYAVHLGCCQAVLVYPEELAKPADIMVGDVHVRSLAFPLDADNQEEFDERGEELVEGILSLEC